MIADAHEIRTLHVTQADIDAADAAEGKLSRDYANTCPIAQALRREFDAKYAHVMPGLLRVADTNIYETGIYETGYAARHYYEFVPTQTMKDYMFRWDRYRTAKPHNFRLKV